MMYTYVKFHHNRSFNLRETVLNAEGRCKFGYAQQRMLSRSRTVPDKQTILVLLRLCHDVFLCEVLS